MELAICFIDSGHAGLSQGEIKKVGKVSEENLPDFAVCDGTASARHNSTMGTGGRHEIKLGRKRAGGEGA